MTWTRSNESYRADKPVDVANLFNSYFYSVFNPPCSTSEYEDFQASNLLEPHSPLQISQLSLSPAEVLNALSVLDVNKATGPDKIPAKLLKNCAPCISNSLCTIFNKCLQLGKLPAAWKVANVIPIHKNGSPGEVSNYRPISLLPLVSKVLERCVYNHLIERISSQLHNLQYGFLKGKSTTSQLLQVLNEIGELLDKRVQVDTIYLDFAKAFDRVDHQLLLKKLRLFGINGSLLCWFSDYLHFRFQKVSVLGKTSTPYLIQNTPVKRTDAQKDLGILVCKDLKWNSQVLAAASNANRMLGFIGRSTLEVKNQSARKALYTALVMSNLSYSSQVWAPQSDKLIEIIERIQRRATKYILSLPYRTGISYKNRLTLTGLFPLCYWHEYLDLVYTYKSIVNSSDTNFKIFQPIRVTRRSAPTKSIFNNYSMSARWI